MRGQLNYVQSLHSPGYIQRLCDVLMLFFFFSQYPAMVIISVLIVLTGLTRPYSSALTNLLDMVLSVNVLILLLIRNTRQANDDLSAVSFHMMKSTDSSSCADYDLDLSTLSYILLPFFYLPLLLTLVAFCVWLARLLRYVYSGNSKDSLKSNETLQWRTLS